MAVVVSIEVSTKSVPRMKTFIDEKNLYRLIGRSDKPQATLKKNERGVHQMDPPFENQLLP
jgi:hypothetical protein